jgi:hypothetical protein
LHDTKPASVIAVPTLIMIGDKDGLFYPYCGFASLYHGRLDLLERAGQLQLAITRAFALG